MPYDLERYKYLWDGTSLGWVLLKSPDLAGGYCVFNELNGALLHIEDEQLNMNLCQRMREMGCKSIDAMPRNEPLDVRSKG
jgi:hypothetical protein